MERVTLAIIGAGSVRCSLPVIAVLAEYFGERPLHVVFYDPDQERLDLFDRLARAFFAFTRSTHTLSSAASADEALELAEKVVVQLDPHGAALALGKKRRPQPDDYARALPALLANVSPSAEVLSLLPAEHPLPVRAYRRLDWPGEPSEAERIAIPHQALRFIHGEDYPFELFAAMKDAPFRAWLDDPQVAEPVVG